MKKITEITSFLFLASLVFFSGLFFITIHVALSQSSTSGSNMTSTSTSNSGTSNTDTTSTSGSNTNDRTASDDPNTNSTGSTAGTSDSTNTAQSDTPSSSDPTNTNTAPTGTDGPSGTEPNNTADTNSGSSGTGTNSTASNTNTSVQTEPETTTTLAAPTTNTAPIPTATESDGSTRDTDASGENNTPSDTEATDPPTQPTTRPSSPSITNTATRPVTIYEETKTALESTQIPDTLDQEYSDHCVAFGIRDSRECQLFLAYDLAPECQRERLLTPQACESFLRTKELPDICRAREILTDETCRETLATEYRQQLYCGDVPADECDRLLKDRFLAQVASADEARDSFEAALQVRAGLYVSTNDIVAKLAETELPRDNFPLTDTSNRYVKLYRTNPSIDVSQRAVVNLSAPYVISFDIDADSIPDDLERYLGSDPDNSDTDNDGYDDIDELRAGYSLTQAGGDRRTEPLEPVAQALLAPELVEQPIIAGTEDPSFTISEVLSDPSGTSYTIRGTARPDTLVLLYLYSKMPLVLTVKTDSSGNFVYSLQESILDGKHTVYVAVTDETGKLREKSSPLAFFVNRAEAETVSNFLRDQVVTPQETKRESYINYYLIGGVSLVLLVLAGFLFFLMRKNARA